MATPAGWYDDGSGRKRWFDGAVWTDRFLDEASPPPPPPPGTAYHPKMDAASPGDLQPKKGGLGLLWGCVGCAVLPVVIFAVVTIVGLVTPDEPYDSNNEYEAIAQCEDRVEDLLKAPATAEFDSSAVGSGTWTVTGTVDAENGFGAMIRSDFQCTVVIEGDQATTTVDFLD